MTTSPPEKVEHVQRSDEWFAARMGKVTASRVADIIATIRSGAYSASRKNYAAELITERLTGVSNEFFINDAIQWGMDQEDNAKRAYEKRTAFNTNGLKVVDVGFIDHPTIAMSGASPDGFVGEDGLIEIKCPMTATHIETLLKDEYNDKYKTQMQWQMACTGKKWCDFVSFDPRLPEDMQLFIERVNRDETVIRNLESEVATFLAEVEETAASLVNKFRKD